MILAEAPYFPSLIRAEMGPQSMHGTVAQSLARLAEAGWRSPTRPRRPITCSR